VHFFIPFVALFPVQGLLIKNFAGPLQGLRKALPANQRWPFFSQLKVKGTWAFAAASKLWSAKKNFVVNSKVIFYSLLTLQRR
jgi:hypothetical protein